MTAKTLMLIAMALPFIASAQPTNETQAKPKRTQRGMELMNIEQGARNIKCQV